MSENAFLNIDISLFPGLGLIFLKIHVPFRRAGVEAQPALELVRSAHYCGRKR